MALSFHPAGDSEESERPVPVPCSSFPQFVKVNETAVFTFCYRMLSSISLAKTAAESSFLDVGSQFSAASLVDVLGAARNRCREGLPHDGRLGETAVTDIQHLFNQLPVPERDEFGPGNNMIIRWQEISPIIVGLVTFGLMWGDWLLTTLQERERSSHYAEHYQSYPVDTIEGNPLLQSAVKKVRLIEVRHILIAAVLSTVVALAITLFQDPYRELFLGYVWGLFLIVGNSHLGNIIGYKASRRGLHGKLYLHQRTALLIQMGRYAALTLFLAILAACATSIFIGGTAVASLTSTLRQLIWLRKVPAIPADDLPLEAA